jgi:hypothetical protein
METVTVNDDYNAPTPDVPDVDEDLVNRQSSVTDKRKAYMTKIRKLGRDHALGTASTMALAEMLLEGTVNGAFTIASVDLGAGKYGKRDDALDAYRAFREQDKSFTSADADKTSFNSKLKMYQNVVYLGMTHGADAQKFFGLVKDTYADASADMRKSFKNFNGIFEAVSDVIREQLARDTAAGGKANLMSDGMEANDTGEIEQVGPNEIEEAFRKTIPSTDDAVKHMIEGWKALTLAQDGRTTKNATSSFVGLKDDRLADIIVELQDFASKNLSPQQHASFIAGTSTKRTRRVIKPPVANAATLDTSILQDNDDQNAAEEQGDSE